MNEEFIEMGLLQRSDCYKAVVLDGCIVQKGDVEMCDLRFFVNRYRNESSPKLEVYKHNRKGKETIEAFYNFDEAVSCFDRLVKVG
jgi:hypothetical protein